MADPRETVYFRDEAHPIVILVEEEDLQGMVCFLAEANPISEEVDHPTVLTFQLVRPQVHETPFVVHQKTWRVHRTTTFPSGHRGMHFVSTDLQGVVVGPGPIPLPVTLVDQTSANLFVGRQNSIVAAASFVARWELAIATFVVRQE
jgi:hypothetical protein